ncbi:MAG: hypothetical protein KAS07_02585 [Candidatus Pacebacteria bacterium]|nr:hypothetical protein [Candidatus Paceibacterota bacterium]
MGEEKKSASKKSDPFDDLAEIYKNVIGSPGALLGFVVFLSVAFFVYWLFAFEGAFVIVQTYFFQYLGPYLPMIKTIATVIILVFAVAIVYIYVRINEIEGVESRKYGSIDVEEEEAKGHGSQWRVVQEHIYSDVPAEWRIAILEADAMLDDALKRAGGKGETLGERLKSLEASEYQTLQSAWDAHKVRNMIAHKGVSFQLTQRETKRVIDLYEKVLQELKYV